MAYEYGVNLKLDSDKAVKDIDALLSKLKQMETLASKVKLNVSTTNDIDKQQQAFMKNIQQMQAAEQKLATQRQTDEQKVAQARNKTITQSITDNQKIAQAEQKLATQRQTDEQKVAQEKAKTAQQEQKAYQQALTSLYKQYDIANKIANLQKQNTTKGNIFTFAGNALTKAGSFMTSAGTITHHVTNALDAVQQTIAGAVNNVLNIVENIGSRFLSYVSDIASSALDQYKTMETAVIGFNNFFTDAEGRDVAENITNLANAMPGVSVEDFLKSVRVLSPYTNGSSEIATGATSGVLKAIAYSGLDVSQVGYKALYNVGQLASGNFSGLRDIRELIRDMPAIEQLLRDSEEGKKLLNADGKLETDTLRNYIEKNGSEAFLNIFKKIGTDSKASGIFDEYAKTLTGATVQARDKLVTGVKQAFEKSGLAKTVTDLFIGANQAGGLIDKISEKVNNLLARVNEFIEEHDIINKLKEIALTAKDYLVEIGKFIGDVIKDLAKSVGILTDAGDIDMSGIKEFLKSVADFIKGFVKGYGDSLKNLMNTIKEIAPRLGIDNWEKFGNIIGVIYSPFGKLVIVFGRLLTAVFNLGEGLTKFGGVLKNIGTWVAQYSSKSFFNPISAAGSISDVGVTGKLKGIAGGIATNVKTLFAKAMKSAAIFAIGEAVTEFAATFVEQAGGKSAGQTARDLGQVVVAGVAVGSQFGVVAGAAAAAAVSLKKVIDASNELTETQEQLARSQREASLSKAADDYLAVAVATLQKLGVYNEFEDKTEHGYEAMLAQANEIARNYTNPEEAVRKLMEIWAKTVGADNTDELLRARSDAWLESENRIITKIDTENEETRQKLIRVYQEMVKEGFLEGQEEGWESGASVESLLGIIKNKGEGITIESNEYLDTIIKGLEEGAINFNDLLSKVKESKLVIKYWDEETEYGSMEEYMAAQGFTFDNGMWKTQAEMNVTIKSPIENFFDALGKGIGDWWNSGWGGLFNNNSPESQNGGGGGGGWAAGGYITPVYKANGGTLSRGIDTVPAMLAPGEYIMKRSAVSKFGIGVMDALNRGDFGFASRSIGSRFSNSWNNSRSYASTVNNNQRTISQQFTINNRTRGSSLNSYYSLANRMASSF